MIDNHLKTTLPVYDSRDRQNFRRAWCADDVTTFALISSSWRFLPFQFQRSINGQDFADMTFTLWTFDDMFSIDVTSMIDAADFNITTVGGYDWLTYFGNLAFSSELDCGTYYLEISDGLSEPWYTEVFQVISFENPADTGRFASLRKVRVISHDSVRKQRIIDVNKIRTIK